MPWFGKSEETSPMLKDYKRPLYSPPDCVMYNEVPHNIIGLKCDILGVIYDIDSTTTIRSVRQMKNMSKDPDKSLIRWKYQLNDVDEYIYEEFLEKTNCSSQVVLTDTQRNMRYASEFKSDYDPSNVDTLIAILDNPTNPSSKKKAVDDLKTKLNTTTLGANINKIKLAFERNGIAYVPPRAVKYGGTRKFRKRKTLRKVRSLKSK